MKIKLLLIAFLCYGLSLAQTVNPALNIWNDITCDTLIIDNDTFVFANSKIIANTIEFSPGFNYAMSLVGASTIEVCNIIFTEEDQRIFFSNGNGASITYTCDNPTTDLSKIVNTSTLSVNEYIKSTYEFNGQQIAFTSKTKGIIYDLQGRILLNFDDSIVNLNTLQGVLIVRLENYTFKIFKK